LDIFEKSAHSAEGKLQVAIAMLRHKKTRLSGRGVHLSQQRGVRGLRSGAGETAKEKETRHIEESILKIERQLDRLEQVRETQRKARVVNRVPHICLIGDTNAGKATILNTLTNSNVLAEDRLFATLDTTTRELYVNGVKKGIISDTVGFIQNLPHQLIDAFKSTLSELQYADLLAHVVDLSNKNWPEHIRVVNTIVTELGITSPMLYIFNKADAVHNIDLVRPKLFAYQPHVLVRATDRPGVAPLINFLSTWEPSSR
jgi:GTP-binding protein HflX